MTRRTLSLFAPSISRKKYDACMGYLIQETQDRYSDFGLKIWLDETTRNGYFNLNSKEKEDAGENRYNICIGTKPEIKNVLPGQISTSDFVDSIMSLKHEERHLMRERETEADTPEQAKHDDVSQHIYRSSRIAAMSREFYKAYYFDLPQEVDAQLYAVTETEKFFKENKEQFPEIDIERDIVAAMQNGKIGWCTGQDPKTLKSVKQITQLLHNNLEKEHPAKHFGICRIAESLDSDLGNIISSPYEQRYLDEINASRTRERQEAVLCDYARQRLEQYDIDCLSYAKTSTSPDHVLDKDKIPSIKDKAEYTKGIAPNVWLEPKSVAFLSESEFMYAYNSEKFPKTTEQLKKAQENRNVPENRKIKLPEWMTRSKNKSETEKGMSPLEASMSKYV